MGTGDFVNFGHISTRAPASGPPSGKPLGFTLAHRLSAPLSPRARVKGGAIVSPGNHEPVMYFTSPAWVTEQIYCRSLPFQC